MVRRRILQPSNQDTAPIRSGTHYTRTHKERAIIEILTCSPEEWIRKQKTKLHRINELAKHLKPKEEHAKQQIDPAVYKVNQHKKIILTASSSKKSSTAT